MVSSDILRRIFFLFTKQLLYLKKELFRLCIGNLNNVDTKTKSVVKISQCLWIKIAFL